MTDIKLLEPQRLSDNPDGGGLATAIEVVDGQINNIFPDISRIDRVNGEVSLRKVFVQATGDDTEVFSGVHAIVQQPPADERVSTVMFEVRAPSGGVFWGSERSDAQSLVERYLDESVITRLIPYDRQLAGSRAVLVYQRPELPLPEIGDVYVLKNESVDPVTTEFIRIQNLESAVETFVDDQGEFTMRVITLTVTQPLTQQFAGSQPNRFSRIDAGKAILRRTIVSDAARFKHITPLAQDADAGAITLKVDSVYAQLAPAAASEAAVTDAEPVGATVLLQSGIAASVSAPALAAGALRRFGRAVVPGSISGDLFSDDGEGNLIYNGDQVVGVVDYRAGTLTPTTVSFGGQLVSATAAVEIGKSSVTSQQPVSISTRGYLYTLTCTPLPKPGTVVVSYRALGKWFDLADVAGDGILEGGQGVGTGSVNFATGTVVVTLGALPDIGSSVIFAWAGSTEYAQRTGDATVLPPLVTFTLADAEVTPGNLSISWPAGGVTKTATANAAGVLSGDGTGSINYETGEVRLRPTLVPDQAGVITATYNEPSTPFDQDVFTPTASGGFVTVTHSAAPLKAGSVRINIPMANGGDLYTFALTDDGSGGVKGESGSAISGATINYTTGEIVIPDSLTRSVLTPTYEDVDDVAAARAALGDLGYFDPLMQPRRRVVGWSVASTAFEFIDEAVVTVSALADAATAGTGIEETFPMPALTIDLTPDSTGRVVPGSVLFNYGGRTYLDRSGVMYYGLDPVTGAASTGGTINYTTGVVSLTSYVGGASGALTKKALLVELNALPLSIVNGRTPGSPLRPGSFFIRALPIDGGAQITASADTNGNIDTADMHGYVDVTTGVFCVEFGAFVLDSALTSDDKAEPWYNVANVMGDGYIWRPREVVPGSVFYNAVIQTTLPLDPRIIGINPVRLPLDGRVQAIRAGDTLVIHDTVVDTLSNPLAANDVEALTRDTLASVVLYDQEGVAVDPDLYTVDLEAGEVTMADPLDLSAYTQPLVARQTVEDMALCIDAQITGDIAIAQPLSRGYTAANSYVSSALVIGDAQARYESLFALNTWVGDWDATTGTGPTSGAQFNDLTYPLLVTNRDAITQRWRLHFTSSTAFNIVGEELGVVGTGTTADDVMPINPATSQPYFLLDKDGFGAGWANGNAIRFNTIAAGAPIWLGRTTRPGPATVADDLARIQVRWDKDEP